MCVLVDDKQRACYLQAFDFENLFVKSLGWDFYRGESLKITVGDQKHVLKPVAQKAGFAVYVCNSDTDEKMPTYPIRRKIEQQLAKIKFEHLIIFIDAEKTIQRWQWIKRVAGKHAVCREHYFSKTQTGKSLLQRLNDFVYTLEDEYKGITITDVSSAVSKALDVEKVTKRFYDRFKTELDTFQKFIDGIAAQNKREWYASLMLNRMMFIYFVQKQGFLDNDTDYLRNRLYMVQSKYGSGKFQQFYRDFLIKLFHDGLGKSKSKRDKKLNSLLGQIPYFNGGLFDIHDLERDYTEISIPDKAFEKIFNFFDEYKWHLDERPRRDDNEINPDVLGYIFEKYINQKHMGAYYTKEDITNYISRSTIIPFLFNTVKKQHPANFDSDGSVWKPLKDDPDHYIYAAVKHGITCTYSPDSEPIFFEKQHDLPKKISVGINDVSRRETWNDLAPAEYALHTETWREVVARYQHYQEIKNRLAKGEIVEINDLVTLNLNVERFARDIILQCESPEMLWAFWHAIKTVSILDPTCGSGAFLFAALNILEPMYAACLEGMRGFVDDLTHDTKQSNNSETLNNFHSVLENVASHPNQRYFVLKSIILDNLYGVDIMEEAVEICKLRLFLKLVAQLENYEQIEPLPDIDFNIRAGNTLVGYTSLNAVEKTIKLSVNGEERFLSNEESTILERINKAAKATNNEFNKFRDRSIQGKETKKEKDSLKAQLDILRDELDGYIASGYKINSKDYSHWRVSHQPFHWFVEFYGIIKKGGFDVIIGNPPYLELRDVDYEVNGYHCIETGAIHALCIERSKTLLGESGCMSMIVPLSLPSTQRMKIVQDILEVEHRSVWYANFAWRPAKLFDEVNRALTIFTVMPSTNPQSLSTSYQKWASDCRYYLFDVMKFTPIPRDRTSFWVPKIGTDFERFMLDKIMTIPTSVTNFMGKSEHRIFYRAAGGLYWKVFTDFLPMFLANGKSVKSTTATNLQVQHKQQIKPLIAIFSSDIFWWWYTITTNVRHLTPAYITNFPVPESIFSDPVIKKLSQQYLKDIANNSTIRARKHKGSAKTETQSFKIKDSKNIIDKIDRVLAIHYGFTDKEMDFIINYDIKYRMGLGE